MKFMAAAVVGCVAWGSVAEAADTYGLNQGAPDLQSADVLAFGPDGILFVGDIKSAAVFAIQTGDKGGDPSKATYDVQGLNVKVAEALGGDSQAVRITDMAVNPLTGSLFVSAANGDKPAIVKVSPDGEVAPVSLKDVAFAKAEIKDAPADAPTGEGQRRRNPRNDVITDIAFVDGQLLVSGMSSNDAPSAVRSLAFPFAESAEAASLEIYHGAHGRVENNSAPRTFVAFSIGGEANLLAGFQCTPLVRFPVSDLKPGELAKGVTVAELGNRNRPLDMIIYEKDGQSYLLLINSTRPTMKIPTAKLEDAAGLNQPVQGGGQAGHPLEEVDIAKGAVQLDKLNDTHAVALLQRESGAQDLTTIELP